MNAILGFSPHARWHTHFEPNQVIFRAGEPANGFYLIETGKVVLEEPQSHGKSMMIDLVSGGEPLGWSWLFAPYLWQFDARAIEPCSALCLSGIMLRQHRDEDFFSATSFSNDE